MRLFPSDSYKLPLPEGHSFPLRKYRLLREALEQSGERFSFHRPQAASREALARVHDQGYLERVFTGTLTPAEVRRIGFPWSEQLVERSRTGFSFHNPQAASREALARVHDRAYLERVFTGALTPAEVRRIGFPWSEHLVERSRRSTGAAIDAAHAALEDGIAASLAGGTHHAGIAFGEGYCVFNDTAVAVRDLQAVGRIRRAAILDLDVHQGNGTAEIFSDDETVFTLSVHGGRNFPLRKVPSSLDIPLEDGTADELFLEAVDRGCREAIERGRPDVLLYIAGADPYRGDRLGRLAVSAAGLRERDAIVFDAAANAGLPLAIVLGGGYCPEITETVAIHAATMREAARRLSRPTPAGRLRS